MARIRWVEDDEATGHTAEVFAKVRAARGRVPAVYRTMSLRPDLLELVDDLAGRAHFSDGYLTRMQKEMIATYVSALNSCPYCATSHSTYLAWQGATESTAAALERGDLKGAGLGEADKLLLELVRDQTLNAWRITDEQVQRVREAGWSDEQISEALFDAALFNFFNRMVNAYGLDATDFVPPPRDP